MTHPTDAAIAQAFRELGVRQPLPMTPEGVRHYINVRARELDAEKGGEVEQCQNCNGEGGFHDRVCCGRGNENGCCGDPDVRSERCETCEGSGIITPPAQAAEAVERVADAIREHYTSPMWPDWHAAARAAIAAMQAGEAGGV